MNSETRCEYSRLTLPNDSSYITAACAYVTTVAEKFGFNEEERDALCKALAEAVANVVQHAFEPGRRTHFDISCERVPLGMQIVIRDQGMPFDPRPFMTDEACSVDGYMQPSGLCLMKEYVDHVEFHNLGKDGKEIVLIKYTQNRSIEDYCHSSELEPYTLPQDQDAADRVRFSITVVPMRPDQAIEVCKTLYKAYGYTYFYPHMYYPDRVADLIRSGHLFSAVALTESGDVAGHGALIMTEPGAKIAEMGIGAVKPEYRSHGVLTEIGRFLTDKARADGLMGIFGQAVTNHTFSQQVGLRAGLRDCAVLLAYVPTTSSFKRISESLSQRVAMVVHYAYLHKPARNVVHLPERHKDKLLGIYSDLGLPMALDTANGSPNRSTEFPADTETKSRGHLIARPCSRDIPSHSIGLSGGPVVRTVITPVMGLAKIFVDRYGENVTAEVKTRLKDLCLKKFEVIYLYLDLADPLTCRFSEQFEELGFFFAGLLPGGSNGDALILQYLNDVTLDYDQIRIKSEGGRAILEYVRQHDPRFL